MTYVTLNDRLTATGGRPAGFDYLRIILATAVIFFHSFDLTTGYNVAYHDLHGFFRPIDALILPMFFSLSGFLVAGSLERSRTLISFLGLRVIRLVPALLVETALSAIIIGLLFTTLPYGRYFSDPKFTHYFLNIVGDIQYKLPGVFESNPFSDKVNGQLWTIPWELRCYIAISIIALVGIARKKFALLPLIVFMNVIFFIYISFFAPLHLDHQVRDTSVHGMFLLQAFLYGITFYSFRTSIIWNKWLFFATVALTLILSSLKFAFWGDSFTPLLAAYMTIYLGLTEPVRLKIVSSGDYSYGIYLYGFPVQQALIATMGAAGLHWYINFPVSLLIAAAIAVCSWHLVEKHAAGLRPALFRGEKRILAWWASFWPNGVPSRQKVDQSEAVAIARADRGDR